MELNYYEVILMSYPITKLDIHPLVDASIKDITLNHNDEPSVNIEYQSVLSDTIIMYLTLDELEHIVATIKQQLLTQILTT